MEHVLFVDDEPHILNALRRLFRGEDNLTCHFAGSPREALSILGEHRIVVLISDHRMPQMTGAEFLARVKERRPNTIRIMLTGEANLHDVQKAVNAGEIFRFVLKPWDDEELKQTVRSAVEYYTVTETNRGLQAANQRQTAELVKMNATLEERVRTRTEQLIDALNTAQAANEQLRDSLQKGIRVFSTLIELASPDLGGHCRRVAEYSVEICRRLEFDDNQTDAIEAAALLHDCGKLGMPLYMLGKSPKDYSEQERVLYETHAAVGADHFKSIEQYDDIRKIISCHHERFDGTGFPRRLRGPNVPVGAYIVGIADLYDNRSARAGGNADFIRKRTYQTIAEAANETFPENIVHATLDFISARQAEEVGGDAIRVGLNDLRPGQELATKLYTTSGSLLAADGAVLTTQSINRIRAVATVDPIVGDIYITWEKKRRTRSQPKKQQPTSVT